MKTAQNMLDLYDRSAPITIKDVRVNDRIVLRWFTERYYDHVDRSFHLEYDVITVSDLNCAGGIETEDGREYYETEGLEMRLVSRSGMLEPEEVGSRVLIREDGNTHEAVKIYGGKWAVDTEATDRDPICEWKDLAAFAIKKI